jgi:hypothetical protein
MILGDDDVKTLSEVEMYGYHTPVTWKRDNDETKLWS